MHPDAPQLGSWVQIRYINNLARQHPFDFKYLHGIRNAAQALRSRIRQVYEKISFAKLHLKFGKCAKMKETLVAKS
jgi:hypothetical protein